MTAICPPFHAASATTAPDPFAPIVEQIRLCGYVLLPDFLPRPLLRGLLGHVKKLDGSQFKRAGIGRQKDFQFNGNVRGDHILWVDDTKHEALRDYFQWMEHLRLALNRALLLGLFDYECHYAYYPRQAFYKKHLDAFRGQSNRRLSTVLYLNPDWRPGGGGELLLYSEDGNEVLHTVAPFFGNMVLFLSEVFPHEVLSTRQDRYSLTGWFRVNDTQTLPR